MRWNVEGADPKTGKGLVISVEAPDALEAERRASQRGMLVSAVHPTTMHRDLSDTDLPGLAPLNAGDAEDDLPMVAESSARPVPLQSTPAQRSDASVSRDSEARYRDPSSSAVSGSSRTPVRSPPRYVATPAASSSSDDTSHMSKSVPGYNDIVVSSRLLDGMASFVRIVGLLCFALAGVFLLSPLAESIGTGRVMSKDSVLSALDRSYFPAVYGLLFFVAASMLRAFGQISLAIRDIARNSFKSS